MVRFEPKHQGSKRISVLASERSVLGRRKSCRKGSEQEYVEGGSVEAEKAKE